VAKLYPKPFFQKAGVAMDWFVLYVRATSEERVLHKLVKLLAPDYYVPFIPYKEWPHVKSGKIISTELKMCFPGYVFIRSTKCVDESFLELQANIYSIKEAYYFLYYGNNKKDIALRDDERNLIERLMNAEFCMDSSLGFMEGDRVKIISGRNGLP
jgi:transcription antitermination factor NusG